MSQTVLFNVEGRRFWRRGTVTNSDGEWLSVEYMSNARPISTRTHQSNTIADRPSEVRSGDAVLIESPTEPGVFWQ